MEKDDIPVIGDDPEKGDRAKQIRAAVEYLGERQNHFTPKEVADVLKERGADVPNSTLYARLNRLHRDAFIEKVRRGTWKLVTQDQDEE